MADPIPLQTELSSGVVTDMKIGGPDSGKNVQNLDQITAGFANINKNMRGVLVNINELHVSLDGSDPTP